MDQVDYIIVGCGLAGIAMCETLKSHKRSFVVYDDESQQSSSVAAGMYNPVILKRFTPVWKAAEQLKSSIPIYHTIEKELGIKIDHQFPLLRRFASVEEQNMWFTAADRPKLSPFLNLKLETNTNAGVDAPYGFGVVNEAGRVDTHQLVLEYRAHLRRAGLLKEESFAYDELLHSETAVHYRQMKAKHIVFAEGFGSKHNPFFKDLPLNGTKGEVLTVKIKDLNLKDPVKSSVFVIPLGNDLYRVGATYSHKDKTNQPTSEGREELLTKLKTFIRSDVQVIDHKAGVRPTVKDRRPLVGRHREFNNIYLLNGLGSRGVMIAPYAAQQLFNHIEHKTPVSEDMDLTRFL